MRIPKQAERIGRLVILGDAGVDGFGRKLVRVKCECKTIKVLVERSLRHNKTQSCGCLQVESVKKRNTKHGHAANDSATPEYEAWRTMMHRCYVKTTDSYPYYGGKGIGVCKKWRENFVAFLADLGNRPSDDHVLCLLDKDKDFKPGNVRWLTLSEANRKKRSNTFYTVNGVTKCFVDWATEYGIPKNTLHYRVVTKGMPMRDALDIGRGRQGKVLPE